VVVDACGIVIRYIKKRRRRTGDESGGGGRVTSGTCLWDLLIWAEAKVILCCAERRRKGLKFDGQPKAGTNIQPSFPGAVCSALR
jgi:hypothetical protein